MPVAEWSRGGGSSRMMGHKKVVDLKTRTKKIQTNHPYYPHNLWISSELF